MKNKFPLLVITLLIQIFCLTTCYGQTTDWKTHSEVVNSKFVVEFKHPSNTVFEHIENGLCIGDNILESGGKSEYIVSQDWCIWMENLTHNSIKSEIDFYEANIPFYRNLIINLMNIDKQEATVLMEIDTNTKKILKTRIYLTRFETLFSIYLYSEKVDEFDQFICSIKISKVK
jgi:hypothetical protein